jgi:hypothetical protein
MVYYFRVACGAHVRNVDRLARGISQLAAAAAENNKPHRADKTF